MRQYWEGNFGCTPCFSRSVQGQELDLASKNYLWLGIGLMAVLTTVIAMLLVRTGIAVARREISVIRPTQSETNYVAVARMIGTD